MENDKTFNRLTGFFDQEREKADHLKEKLGEEAAALANEARERLRLGTDSLHLADEAELRAIRANRALFLIAGASLLGLMIASSFLLGKVLHRDK